MAKRIVFCADGTWDDPQSDTNVVKLFRATTISASQVAFYDDGVGADGTPLQQLDGGAMGDGIIQKVQDGYAKIAHIYEPGDQIFLFGFSRGSYTARSIAGMIAICGLPAAAPTDALIDTAFQAYRNTAGNRAALLAQLTAAGFYDAKITMVGVFDTVGALGIPAIAGGIDMTQYAFLDTTLHPDVQNAYHALSIDERRREFPATLWTGAPAAGQTIEQVWFAGVHCDVGGGYPQTGLSDITLAWMAGKAAALGLDLDSAFQAAYLPAETQYSLDQNHESWNILWLLPRQRPIAANASIGNSVNIRLQIDKTYDPSNLQFTRAGLSAGYALAPVVPNP